MIYSVVGSQLQKA